MWRRIRNSWEKNWPEVHCAIRRGVPGFFFARRPEIHEAAVPVFCYHGVEAEQFEADLLYLRRNGYTTLKADELLAHLQDGSCRGKRGVVLAFDDGAFSLYRVVYPLLRKYQYCAVAFVSPHFHDLATDRQGDERLCTWNELAEMVRSGCLEVQSHTFEHRYLPRWPEPVALQGAPSEYRIASAEASRSLEDDLRLAKESIERRLGTKVRHLAFPRFNGTAEATRIGKTLGYEAFWWGTLPGRPDNRPGDCPNHIVRLSGEFLRRLPGNGRVPLRHILSSRYSRSLFRGRAGLSPGQ